MRNLFLALHLLATVFAVGPLVHAATTAGRGVRTADGPAIATAARTVRLYSLASILVAVLGFAVMGMKEDGEKQVSMADTWVWLSLLLYLIALAVALLVLVPSLQKAGATIGGGGDAKPLVGRVAAAGGVIALIFAVIIFLMVFRPGG